MDVWSIIKPMLGLLAVPFILVVVFWLAFLLVWITTVISTLLLYAYCNVIIWFKTGRLPDRCEEYKNEEDQ